MRAYWSKIVCVTESRMDFTAAVDRFKGELRSLFLSFRYGDANQLAFFLAELRTPIMHAGRSQTLLRMTYDGVQRLAEPYALAFKWRKLAPPDPEPAARIGWGVIGRLVRVMSTSRDPVRARARTGRWALAARTMPQSGRRKVFRARLPAGEWPAKMLKVTAVDARTGEFVVFDSAGEAGHRPPDMYHTTGLTKAR